MLMSPGTLIGYPSGNKFSAYGTPGFSLTAPVLTWTTASNDTTPGFDVDLDPTVAVDDVITLEYDNNSDFSSPTDTETNVVDAGEAAAFLINFVLGALGEGTYYFRAKHSRGASDSAWSNTETVIIDTTAPTITSGTTANNAENAVLAHALTANESVTWALNGGDDAADFEISGSTLRWASNGTKDYETPDDTGTNNVYNVTVRATDTAGNTTDQNIAVTVTNVAENPVTYEDAGIAIQAANGTTSTFTAKAIGATATGRLLLIFVSAAGSPLSGQSGLTVNGNAATLVGSELNTTNIVGACYKYALDTGTTADIVASWNGTLVGRAVCAVFAIYDANHTETDTDGSITDNFSAATMTATIDVPSNGIAFAFEAHGSDAATTWSGTDTVADTATTHVETFLSGSTAHNETPGAGKVLTATWTGDVRRLILAAAFGI